MLIVSEDDSKKGCQFGRGYFTAYSGRISRSNILCPSYKFTGVGVAVAEDGITYYLTQNQKETHKGIVGTLPPKVLRVQKKLNLQRGETFLNYIRCD